MDNFLALIRKSDFVDLFKYGSIHINKDIVRPFTCSVSELSERPCIFNDLKNFANAFESTFEYIIIHYTKVQGRVNDVLISDVQGIYPLDYEAKSELSLTLDLRIVINNPIWPDAVLELQKKQTFDECKNGINNVWKIYNLPDTTEKIQSFVTDAMLHEVVEQIYQNRHPQGELPIWVYILRYERHAFYPNTTVGYFMDSINAVFNYMQQREVDSSEIENTKIMQFLYHINSIPEYCKSFNKICEVLSSEPLVTNILDKIHEIEQNCDLLKAATLFFIFRDRYKDDFKYEELYHTTGMKSGFDFSVACYLLGFILGHEHTYDCLYSHLPLPIFVKSCPEPFVKKKESVDADPQFPSKTNEAQSGGTTDMPIQVEELKEDVVHIVSEMERSNEEALGTPQVENVKPKKKQKASENSLFAEEGTPLDDPIPMKKGQRGRKITYAHTEEQFFAMLDNGYFQVDPNKMKSNIKKK